MAAVPAGIAAVLIVAQIAPAWSPPRAADPVACGSVVVTRCATPAAKDAARSGAPPTALDAAALDTIVIEASRLPAPPSLRELLQRAARPDGPVRYTTREGPGGSRCTCYEPCVIACCQCSGGGGQSPPAFAR